MARHGEETVGYMLFLATRSARGVRFLDSQEKASYFSYAQLWELACRTAGHLQAAGLRPGDRAALVLPTGPDFYAAFFGTIVAGGIPVPLAPPPSVGALGDYQQRITQMLQAVDATVLVTNAKVRRMLTGLWQRVQLPLGCLLVERCSATRIRLVPVAPDDTALIQFSAGTTLDLKAVRLTHRQVLANVRAIIQAITSSHPEDSSFTHAEVSCLPLHHSMGLIGAVLVAVAWPRDLTLIAPEHFVARPAVWLRAISRYGATISPAPNFAYSHCLEHVRPEELREVDLSSWRLALDGTEPIAPGTLERFVACYRRHGLRPAALTPLYGLAEATLAVTCADPRQPATVRHFDSEQLARFGRAVPTSEGLALVSAGRPLPGFELRLVDQLGQPVAEGNLGRVLVRGPSIMQGYYGDQAATRALLTEGWLDTGDTGFLLGGELFLHGPAKDLIMLNGHSYAPQQLEQAIDEVPGVQVGCSAAISCLLGEEDRQMLLLFVERAPRSDPRDDERLARRVADHVAVRTSLAADRVVVLDRGTLPRTFGGKIRREETLHRYLAGELVAPPRFSWWNLAGELLHSFWTQVDSRR